MPDQIRKRMNKGFLGKHDIRWKHWQEISFLMLLYDVIAVNFSYVIALWIRFDCRFLLIPARYLDAWKHFAS